MSLAGDVWGASSASKKDGSDDEHVIKFDLSKQYHIRGKRTSTRSAAFVHSGQSYNPSPEALQLVSTMAAYQVKKASRDIDRIERRIKVCKRARGVPNHMFAHVDSDASDIDGSDAEAPVEPAPGTVAPPSKRAMKKEQERKMRAAASLALPQADRNRAKRREAAARVAAARAVTTAAGDDVEAAAAAADLTAKRLERLGNTRARHAATAGDRAVSLGPARGSTSLEVALPDELPSSLRTLQKAASVLHPASVRAESLLDRGLITAHKESSARRRRIAKQRTVYNVYDRKISEQKAREKEIIANAHPANKTIVAAVLEKGYA